MEIPSRWTRLDRGGQLALLPPAVRFLDRIRALAIRLDRPPSPGYIVSLRGALGLTQAELARKLGVDKLTVSRWERGAVRPSKDSLAVLEKLRSASARQGVKVSE